MDISLFSLFAGYGFGKVMDVLVDCFSCKEKFNSTIDNVQYNNIYCPNCHRDNTQFTNACDFTVNRRTNEIGHGIIGPDQYKWQWKGGGIFSGPSYLYIPHDILLKGFLGRDLILKTEIRNFDSQTLLKHQSSLLTPTYYSSRYRDHWHAYSAEVLPNDRKRYLTTVEIKIDN